MENVYVPPVSPSHRKALVLGLLGLASFLAVEALLLRSYTRHDTRPPSWDQSIHMEIALDYREALKDGRWGDAWYLPPKPGMPPFPPLYHLLLTQAYGAADPAHAALWINWFYLAVMAIAIFGLAWHFRPDETALAATVMFVAAPGIQELLTTQLVDLPLIAMAAAAYWALIASDGFSRWTAALFFGVLHAAGMLHKWSFFSYMLPAYGLALAALRDKRTAAVMLSAAVLSAAITFPWYAAHLVLLPSRIVQASADFAVPVWTTGAWAIYFQQASSALGPILWVMGSIALIVPQFPRRREHGWILLAWVATSYFFWTIVPNRQIRFLLPGLVPLGVAFCSVWPKLVIWSAAGIQLLGLCNYFGGWIRPIALAAPYYQLTFFASAPAMREDWKTEEILRKVEAERDPSRPVTNVTLVANDHYFNAPTFHWTRRRLGLEHARMRGVNRRLCELSEFVLLKDPKLGPAGVIPGLPEAAAEVLNPRGWFHGAYEEIARWPLPDHNSAVLFRQRRLRKKPYNGKTMAYQFFTAGKVELTELKARFGAWDPQRSLYKTVGLTAKQADIHGLVLSRLNFELEDVGFVPVGAVGEDDRAAAWLDMRLLRLERLRVKSLDVGAAELKTFLAARVKGLVVSELLLDKTVRLAGSYRGLPVGAEAAVELLDNGGPDVGRSDNGGPDVGRSDSPRRLKIDILSASVAGVKIPVSMFREIKELVIPLDPYPETPFFIDLPGLTIKNGRLTVP